MTPKEADAMNALIPEDLRDDYEDFARPSDSVKEAAWRLYARKLIERIAAPEQERDHLRAKLALLTDPAAVHINILRGDLPLTKAQAVHIAGLPADVEQELERLRADLSDDERDEIYAEGHSPELYERLLKARRKA